MTIFFIRHGETDGGYGDSKKVRRETVVVSHGGVSRVLRGHILGLKLSTVPLLEVPQDRVLVLDRNRVD